MMLSMNHYLDILEETGNSLMIYKYGELIFESSLKGIRPHLKAINELGEKLEDTLVVDKYGVKFSYREEVPHIKMENGVIYCPFERMVQGMEDPDEAYKAIIEKMNSFKSSSS